MALYDITATVEYIEPPIRRVLRVREDVTLFQLHRGLQVALGWSDLGFFYFEVGEREFGPSDAAAFARDAGAVTVGELAGSAEEPGWSYGYFPAEEALWDVELLVEPAVAEADRNDDGGDVPAMRCVGGTGSAPLEELKGPFGHMDASDDEPGDSPSGGNGAGPTRRAPQTAGAFDLDAVNERLSRLEAGGWQDV